MLFSLISAIILMCLIGLAACITAHPEDRWDGMKMVALSPGESLEGNQVR